MQARSVDLDGGPTVVGNECNRVCVIGRLGPSTFDDISDQGPPSSGFLVYGRPPRGPLLPACVEPHVVHRPLLVQPSVSTAIQEQQLHWRRAVPERVNARQARAARGVARSDELNKSRRRKVASRQLRRTPIPNRIGSVSETQLIPCVCGRVCWTTAVLATA